MIQFNELRIPSEGNKLIIDVSIQNLPEYENIYIDTINIDTQDTFVSAGPSDKYIYTNTIEGNQKSVRLELNDSDIKDINNSLFFVYIKVKGGDENIVYTHSPGITYYKKPIYDAFLLSVKEVEQNKDIPKYFINVYLKVKAFEISLAAKKYVKACDYYNKFIKNMYSKINHCI